MTASVGSAELGPAAAVSVLDEQDTPRARLAAAVRALQDGVRGSLLTDRQASLATARLVALAADLAAVGVDDVTGAPDVELGPKNMGQVLSPVYEVVERDARRVVGTVRFPRLYLGSEGAVHGGAIALWADDVLGRLGRAISGDLTRTAYMRVDYRGLVPVERTIDFTAEVESVEGRKRNLVATLLVRGEVAAQARGLWVQVRR